MTGTRWVFETDVPQEPARRGPDAEHYWFEDSGMARVLEVGSQEDKDEGMFVRVQSWAEPKPDPASTVASEGYLPSEHPDMDRLHGKRVRVTVEVVGPEDGPVVDTLAFEMRSACTWIEQGAEPTVAVASMRRALARLGLED